MPVLSVSPSLSTFCFKFSDVSDSWINAHKNTIQLAVLTTTAAPSIFSETFSLQQSTGSPGFFGWTIPYFTCMGCTPITPSSAEWKRVSQARRFYWSRFLTLASLHHSWLLAKDSEIRGKSLRLRRTHHRRRTLRKTNTTLANTCIMRPYVRIIRILYLTVKYV